MEKKTILPNGWYDILKWISIIVLPALGVLYEQVGLAWGWPYIEAVKTTCLSVGLFIGTCIGVSSYQYNKSNGNG